MSKKNARLAAWSITSLSALLIAAGVLLGALAMIRAGSPVGLLSHQLTVPLSGAVFAGLGALVLPRHPRHPIAWMLASLGAISGFEVLNLGVLAYSSLKAPGEVIPAPDIAHWLAQWLWSPRAYIPLTLLLLLFPDGKVPSRRWRPAPWAAAFGIVVSTVTSAFAPGSWEALGGIVRNPFAVRSQLWGAAQLLSSGLLLVVLLGCMASVFVRFKRAKGIERQQLKWMTYAMGMVLFLFGASASLYALLSDPRLIAELTFSMVNVATIGIALAASVAVLRHRLYDIDIIINRTLVYGALTASVVAIYVLSVGLLSVLFQEQGNPVFALLATGLVAVLFQPLRERLQRAVNRLLFGERDDPLSALLQLGERLKAAIAPEIVIPTLVETVAETLKLPYVAISLKTGEEFTVAAEIGSEMENAKRFPLIYQGEVIGELIASPRSPRDVFGLEDRNLLENIALQAGSAVYSIQVTAALQRSRQQLVAAREEERRRLRRDLHDGLGATLAGLNLEAGALKRSIRSDPQKAEALVDEFREDIRASIEDIRNLVYELRPPTLDQLGLVEAVRAQAAQCSRSEGHDGSNLQVKVEAPEALPPLPAAVEVAAYRIAQEALTNVLHHAQARQCVVRLEMTDELRVEVVDDGLGLANGRQPNNGLGLLSMRERAEELGGTFAVEPVSEGGTRVAASLPLREM